MRAGLKSKLLFFKIVIKCAEFLLIYLRYSYICGINYKMYLLQKIIHQAQDVYVFRHAQPDHSPGHIFPSKHAGLSPLGIAQAYSTGQRLAEKGIQPTLILCSPMERAKQTVQALESGFSTISEKHIPIIFLEDLKEINIGSYPVLVDVLGVLPWVRTILRMLHIEKQSWVKYEKITDVEKRIARQLLDMIHAYPGPLLVIGHQVVNSCMESVLTGKPWRPWLMLTPHVGIHHFVFSGTAQTWSIEKKYSGKKTMIRSNIPRSFF